MQSVRFFGSSATSVHPGYAAHGCFKDGQRGPLATVDTLVMQAADDHELTVPLALWDKTKMTREGLKRIRGLVMAGGHVEAREHGSIEHAMACELEEELGLTPADCIFGPKLALVYANLEADPRNRYITFVHVLAVRKRAAASEELKQVFHVPLRDLTHVLRHGLEHEGETLRMILGHDDKIARALETPAYAEMLCSLVI